MNGTLLCGVDDSDRGGSALDLSLELSERLGMRLVVAHIAEVMTSGGPEDLSDDDRYWRDRRGAQASLNDLARSRELDPAIERRIAVGDVAGSLARIAAEEAADLIVVGSDSGRRKLLRRSVTMHERLASETPVPVLVAPTRRDSATPARDAASRS